MMFQCINASPGLNNVSAGLNGPSYEWKFYEESKSEVTIKNLYTNALMCHQASIMCHQASMGLHMNGNFMRNPNQK